MTTGERTDLLSIYDVATGVLRQGRGVGRVATGLCPKDIGAEGSYRQGIPL